MINQSPLSSFIGNERATRRMRRFAHAAKSGSAFSVALIGQASTGKTLLARLTAGEIATPYAELSAHALRSPDDLYEAIEESQGGFPLDEHTGDEIARPCVVCIDEVHALRGSIVPGLLKATEHNDRTLECADGTLDVRNVSWIVCTTDWGDLFEPLTTRFSKVELRPYNLAEVARIVALNFPTFSEGACALVANYAGNVPREALSFAREMLTEYQMTSDPVLDIARRVADDCQIKVYQVGTNTKGMQRKRVAVLSALGHGPLSSARLAREADVKPNELERFVLPPLFASKMITITSRGRCITPIGIQELNFMGIAHDGNKAMPASVRKKWKVKKC